MTEPEGTPGSDPATACPWCAAPTTAGATRCAACGAALAQRESIGELTISGLTSVDPALKDYDQRPLHLRGPSPSQGMAPALIVGAMAGGPIGLAAVGGVAALAAVEYLGASGRRRDAIAIEDVGRPSEVMLQAIDQLDATGATPAGAAADTSGSGSADAGGDIWHDLPEPKAGEGELGEEDVDGG